MKILAAVATLCLAHPAAADTIHLVPTCVEIDATLDQLPAAEQARARVQLVRVLEAQDQLIVETGCEDTIRLSHEREGDRVLVRMRGTRAARRMRVSIRASMVESYTKMAVSLLAPPPPEAPQPAPVAAEPAEAAPDTSADHDDLPPIVPVTRPSGAAGFELAPRGDVVPLPEEQAPIPERPMWYVQYGFGLQHSVGGAAFAGGYRFPIRERVVGDLSTALSGGGEGADKIFAFSARARVFHVAAPLAEASMYVGGGLSLGHVSAGTTPETWEGGGLQGELAGGYIFNRDGKRRYLISLDVTLPAYTIDGGYSPAFAMAFGVGW